jgi:outer membrane immunogenic protein
MMRILIPLAAAVLMGGTAMAADLPIYEPPPVVETAPVVNDWSGFYIGAHGGWGWDEDDEDGFVVGGQIGVNWQWNYFVLGIEGDGSYYDADDGQGLASARLRAGLAFDRLLLYGTGGAGFTFEDSDEEVGWAAGGGAEFMVTDNVTLGAEYLHYDFDDGDDTVDVVRGRVNVKFNSIFGGM